MCKRMLRKGGLVAGLLAAAGCGASDLEAAGMAQDSAGRSDGPCGNETCPEGFHCEFDSCVPDQEPPTPASQGRDPLASRRYVFSLETDTRRLVRIDSSSLETAAFVAGLSPMDLAVVGSRELSVVLDAFDTVEVLDHRVVPPTRAAWITARSLSHLEVSPTGMHGVAYFDWDDPRAQDRQPEPGNINQVTVAAIEDRTEPFSDSDNRVRNVAVGFLPRDVRFSSDGARAVVVSRDTITSVSLLSTDDGVAEPEGQVAFDGSAEEILLNPEATLAMLRFANSPRVEVIDLPTGEVTCFLAERPVTDIVLARDSQLVIDQGDASGNAVSIVDPLAATGEPCVPAPGVIPLTVASRLAADPASSLIVAYEDDRSVETIWVIDLTNHQARPITLEKAVLAVAFVGDGQHAFLSHLKVPGVPAWDPTIEDPELSVDKSYGVSWVDLTAETHRLAVSDVPFGPFSFVPAANGETGATFQSVADEKRPQILRVAHRPGFDDQWIDLAATPLQMGYLEGTEQTYVTQSHPWGRVTFVDRDGESLRHVTGYAMEVN